MQKITAQGVHKPSVTPQPVGKESTTIQKNEKGAYPWYFISWLNKINKDILYSSVFIQGYKGTIIDIDTKPHVSSDGSKSVFYVNIKGDAGTKKNFVYNEDVIKRTTITAKNKAKKTSLKLTDLKIGDTIVVEETVDNLIIPCTDDTCIKEVIIQRLD